MPDNGPSGTAENSGRLWCRLPACTLGRRDACTTNIVRGRLDTANRRRAGWLRSKRVRSLLPRGRCAIRLAPCSGARTFDRSRVGHGAPEPRRVGALQRERMMLSAVETYAHVLKTNQGTWIERLEQKRPASDPTQIASEALKLALERLRRNDRFPEGDRHHSPGSPEAHPGSARRETLSLCRAAPPRRRSTTRPRTS